MNSIQRTQAKLIASLLLGQNLIPAAFGAPTRSGPVVASASTHSKRLPRDSRTTRAVNVDSRPMTDDEKVEQVLNRLTLGARPGDYEKVKSMGVREFIEAQLDPQSIAESPLVEQQSANAKYLHQNSTDLISMFREAQKEAKAAKDKQLAMASEEGGNASSSSSSGAADVSDKKAQRKALLAAGGDLAAKKELIKDVVSEYYSTRLIRELYSPRQLQEVMVDFWFNHFNVSMKKGLDNVLVGPYEEQAIRPYTMGRFRDLVGATCHHPGMLFYLDNWQNAGPQANGVGGGKKAGKSGLNENYARELMELHTLGVDGGYTQKDVTELARVLTGLSLPAPALVQRGALNPNWGAFYPNRHDSGDKLVLGEVIKGSGENEIEHCLDLLCRAPATAHHVCYKLAQYFVADEPPPALVDRLAKRFLASDGNIKDVLVTLFNSPEFFDARYLNAKYKNPFRYTISAARASGAQFDGNNGYKGLIGFMNSQGQPLYGCLTPDGYKNTKDAWLNSDSLLKRLNFATGLGVGRVPGETGAPEPAQVLSALGGHISSKTRAVLAKTPEQMQAGLLLGSPDFMNY